MNERIEIEDGDEKYHMLSGVASTWSEVEYIYQDNEFK